MILVKEIPDMFRLYFFHLFIPDCAVLKICLSRPPGGTIALSSIACWCHLKPLRPFMSELQCLRRTRWDVHARHFRMCSYGSWGILIHGAVRHKIILGRRAVAYAGICRKGVSDSVLVICLLDRVSYELEFAIHEDVLRSVVNAENDIMPLLRNVACICSPL